MKAERYLLGYIMKSDIPVDRVKSDIGIDIAEVVRNNRELMADEFIQMCIYLGINPDDVMNEIV